MPNLRWVCPLCQEGKLAPSRPRKNDSRRYCLKCSEKEGKLVERVSPRLEAKLEIKKAIQAKRRKSKYQFKAPPGYYVVGGMNLLSAFIAPIPYQRIRVRMTKGPGPLLRKADGLFIFRKGDWADQFDAHAQLHVARALAQFWRGNLIATPERLASYVRQFVESVSGVRPKLERGLKQAPEEVADLLRKKAAIDVLAKPGVPLARQA